MYMYIKMYRIMTYLKITMSNLKEEIQAVTMKMNQMRNQQKNNISKIYWKKEANGASSLMLMKR